MLSAVRGRGADDNASGVGVMLEVAAALRAVSTPYTIRFIAFGAEEPGLSGSRYHVDGMSAGEIENTVVMINLDSLIADEIAYIYGNSGDAGMIQDWVLRRGSENSQTLQTQPSDNAEFPAGTTSDCSGHTPFAEAGIQYSYFEPTNWSLGNKDG